MTVPRHNSERGDAAAQRPRVAIRVNQVCRETADIGASASAGSVADSYGDSMAEALNGIRNAELIEMRGPWKDIGRAERAIFQRVTWCNEERRHPAPGYVPPAEHGRHR
ncbi:hypothetical protein [Streptomyces axinellae]|uniref:Integrase catalytic domain-containing protein n=1 Tax=Streptomyces axinellae TaxID=552788 RepID=A0ABP6BYG0_9ACTN